MGLRVDDRSNIYGNGGDYYRGKQCVGERCPIMMHKSNETQTGHCIYDTFKDNQNNSCVIVETRWLVDFFVGGSWLAVDIFWSMVVH